MTRSPAILTLATLTVLSSASSAPHHAHTIETIPYLDRRGPAIFPADWQPDVENWGPLPKAIEKLASVRVDPTNVNRVPVTSEALQADITTEALLNHAEILEAIAYQTTARNRVFGSAGHNFTALYLYELISRELGDYYDVAYQPFIETYSSGSAALTVDGNETALTAGTFSYGNSGKVSAPLVAVGGEGCNATDFSAEVAGNIAFIVRGTCAFGVKAALAGEAGAVGAIIYNNVEGELSGTLGGPNVAYPPVAGISLANGQALLARLTAGETVTANLDVVSIMEDRVTMNVIAQTKTGDPDNVIFVGAHADSVDAGPGINDNGSGSIGILEVARNLAKYSVTNAVRFAWWSAEEFGLLGARYYVNQSSVEDLSKIRLYLNFDMIASPNYKLSIYDGDGSAFNLSGPAGSAEAEKLFEEYFVSVGLPSQPTEFNGRSDYGPFLDAGVAAGGLFTGAEQAKTEAEAALYGGEAGVAFDANYHRVGDTVANLNMDAFLVNSKAIAHAVATYATSFESLPPKGTRKIKRQVWNSPARIQGCHEAHDWDSI